jgi:hypothetical protein
LRAAVTSSVVGSVATDRQKLDAFSWHVPLRCESHARLGYGPPEAAVSRRTREVGRFVGASTRVR